MIWPWNLFLPLALGISSVVLGIGFYFAHTWTRQIVAGLCMPLGVTIVLALIYAVWSGSGYEACFIFSGAILWAYLGIPGGIVLGFLFRLMVPTRMKKPPNP